ncbi:MAG: bifunctional diaminohydroxyphosphoribosylaminopyrimidine deaminase/5-amino-6-(5-phosphoribosylamino)uracil reductase RibD [Enterobacteriaceae bacterium]
MFKKNKFYLNKAIKLAKKGMNNTSPNPRVGCIIVKDNLIIGKGYHRRYGEDHAEIMAIKNAKKNTKNSTIYITLEPCCHKGKTPPCTKAIIKSGIKKAIISTIDPNPKVSGKGIKELKKNGVLVKYGILEKKSKKLNKGFIKRMKTGLPFVILKLALSIDGKISTISGESKWITSYESRQDVQKLRFYSDAILSTSNTILNDNPKLNIRYKDLPKKIKKAYNKKKNPIKIIIDSNNKIHENLNFIKDKSEVWLIRLKKDKKSFPKNVKQIIVKSKSSEKNKIDLKKLIKFLGKKKINTLLIECGSKLSGELIKNKLIDELIIYQAPKILGSNNISAFNINKIKKIKQAIKLKIKNVKKIGRDIKITLKLKK